MESITQNDSWWTNPTVQRDREAFRAAQRAQEGRWLAEQQRIGKLMAGIATEGWMVNGGKRKGMLGSISAGAL